MDLQDEHIKLMDKIEALGTDIKRLKEEIFQYNEELSDALTDRLRLWEVLERVKDGFINPEFCDLILGKGATETIAKVLKETEK